MSETRQSTTEQLRSVNRDDRTVDLIISTFDIDSYGTRIDQSGWDFESFKKNPVICLQHDDRGYTDSNGLPIANGIPETIRVEGNKTFMRIRFPDKGKFEIADTVFELVADGFMRGVSVGFNPIEDEVIEEEVDGYKKSVRIYRRQQLLEVSLVTIPSNDNALVQRAASLNTDVTVVRRMTEQLEHSLIEQQAPKPEDIEKWKRYFEQKQPTNREATKVLEKFYKRILKEDAPADEVEAWKRMGEGIDTLEETKEEEIKQDETITEVKQEEVVADVVTPPEVVEVPTTTEPSPPAPDARKAFVQISLAHLPALKRSITEACVEAAVKALQQGIPQSDANGVIDATGTRFREALFSTPTA